jgi:membrane protease YdiL (CAAX protease family)
MIRPTLEVQSRLERGRPATFLALVAGLSLPFWILGAVSHAQLLPGLPVADSLIVVCPLLAAAILARPHSKALLLRAFDYRRIQPRTRLLPIVVLMPAVSFVSYAITRDDRTLVPSIHVSWFDLTLMFLGFMLGAIGEEVGWTAYATERMRRERTALETGVVLGVAWAAWHLPQLLQLHRPAVWIAWWTLGTIEARILMVWIYDHAGKSVFAVVLFHTMLNLSWQLFPSGVSSWDPRLNALLLLAVVAPAALWSGVLSHRGLRPLRK